MCFVMSEGFFFFFQAEDGIRDAQESRGLGDVYKRQLPAQESLEGVVPHVAPASAQASHRDGQADALLLACLLYTSDAADDLLCVDLGGRRLIQKKQKHTQQSPKLSC